MGGTNPYMESAAVRLPSKPYKLTILPANRVIEVDPAKLPYSRHGAKGSILEIALGNGLEIDHACGGVCACTGALPAHARTIPSPTLATHLTQACIITSPPKCSKRRERYPK